MTAKKKSIPDSWVNWLSSRQEILRHVKISRTSDEERRNLSYHIHLSDLESTDGLDNNEREMLKDLITNGNYVPLCKFNEQGYVESLSLGVNGEISKNVHFPYLYELEIFYKTPISLSFIYRHHLSLRFLSLRGQNLSEIPDLSRLTNLIRLDFSNNRLITINWFGDFSHLQDLDLSQNRITSLRDFGELNNCINLQLLNLMKNQIDDLCNFESLSCLKNLQILDLSYNNLNELNITSVIPNLVNLNLSHNHIKSITAVKNLPELNTLDISYNEINYISNIKNLNNLKILHLSDNNIDSFSVKDFENMKNLEKIFTDDNPIKNISGLEFLTSNPEIRYVSPENFSDLEVESFKSYLRSIGWRYDDHILYKPPPPQAEFIVNDYITLRLEDGDVNLYINDEIFEQCAILLLTIPVDTQYSFNNIASIDEAAELFEDQTLSEAINAKIPKETLFWGHASNLQAWYEHNYDTRLLHSNFAFPLLRRLTEVGDPIAKRVFKEEIARRYASGYPSVVEFLKEEGYLNYLSKDELLSLEK